MNKTLIRSIATLVVMILDSLAIFGVDFFKDVTADQVYTIVLAVVSIVVIARAWWKNNSFTAAAKKADEIMRQIKEDGLLEDGEEEAE